MNSASIFVKMLVTTAILMLMTDTLAAPPKSKRLEGYPDSEIGYINKLLTYKHLESSEITLPMGASHPYMFQIYYHKKVDPTNIIIELNGKDISDMFTFEQGESEIIEIPIELGKNVLKLRALELISDGSGSTPMWDHDSFTINLPHRRGTLDFTVKKS